MSMLALLNAVADRTKTLLTLTEANVSVSYDGRPPAFAGEEYWCIHPGNFSNDKEQTIEGVFNATITLTRKTGFAPQDRIGPAVLLDITTGMYKRAELLIGMSGVAGLHMDYLTLDLAGGTCSQLATTWTGGKPYSIPATRNGFWHPLRFADCSKPMVKGPAWFWASGPTYPKNDIPTGVAMEIYFVGAMRDTLIEAP